MISFGLGGYNRAMLSINRASLGSGKPLRFLGDDIGDIALEGVSRANQRL